jgi:hypothetical protein
MAPWFAAEIVRKSGGAVTREGVLEWLTGTDDGREYLLNEARDHGKRTWKSFNEIEAEKKVDDDDADDNSARNENFGEMAEKDEDTDDDSVIARAIAAHGGKITPAEALTWLRSDSVGREFARAHSKGEEPMDTEQKLAKFAARAGDVVALAKSICESGLPATMADQNAFTKLVTAYACERFPGVRADVAFSKLYCDSGEDGRAIRKALAVIKNQMVITPVYVGGTDALPTPSRNDGSSSSEHADGELNERPALEQLNDLVEEQRRRAPFMSKAQAFAAVYRDNPELAKRERQENRPTGHPSYPR